ncbi:CPBP family glutamic-type intramembrane protease [Kineococcus sp. NBC_00420]|uniref:CPBP family glutamic-type intramembrane protease n=1 Tax=unclassified Kineococcus TaxID=2621656 RepID=UPI002E21C5F1
MPAWSAPVSWAVFVLALGLAGVAAAAAEVGTGEGWFVRAAPALTTLLVAVPLLLVVHRRRRTVLALRNPRQAVVGAGVVLTSAVAVFGVGAAAGATRVSGVDASVLVTFLVLNTLAALALEAVPEELAFRGGVFGALASRVPTLPAAAATTALFVLAPAASISLTWAVGSALGLPVPPPTFAPGGQDPVAYAVLLAVFGSMLVLARLATGSVWACVAAHLTFLTVNRTVFPSASFRTGVDVAVAPGAELLVLVYLGLATAGFAVLARRHRTGR